MRTLSLVFIICLCMPSFADTAFIREDIAIPLRNKPCQDCEITANIVTGNLVQILNTQGAWSFIDDQSTKGWIKNVNLSDNPPLKNRITILENDLEEAQQNLHTAYAAISKHKNTIRNNHELNLENNRLKLEREKLRNLSQEPQITYAKNILLLQQKKELIRQNSNLNDAIQSLESSKQSWLVFYGILAILIGSLLPPILQRIGKRRFS